MKQQTTNMTYLLTTICYLFPCLAAAGAVPFGLWIDVKAECGTVGEGPLRRELRAKVAKSDLAGRVDFVGFKNQKELPAHLAVAACLVLPSDGTKTWGLIINKSMASGKPAIDS